MGAYALIMRCDVFGNAQTSNLIHFVMSILGGDFADILIRTGGMLLYMAGVILAVYWNKKMRSGIHFIAIGVDAAAFVILGFFPEHMDNVLALYPAFFAMALQWSAFPGVYGYNCSTIFSTNNFKQLTMATTEYIMEHDKKQAHKAKFYGGTLLFFHIGAAGAYIACREWGVKASWAGMIPAAAALALIIYENVDVSEVLVFEKRGKEKIL